MGQNEGIMGAPVLIGNNDSSAGPIAEGTSSCSKLQMSQPLQPEQSVKQRSSVQPCGPE